MTQRNISSDLTPSVSLSMSSYDVSQLLVRLGDYDISTPFEAKHSTYKVARIVRHKGFSEKTLVSVTKRGQEIRNQTTRK